IAPAPAPPSENPPLPLPVTATATPIASSVMSPVAVTSTPPPTSTSPPSIAATVWPPIVLSALVTDPAKSNVTPPDPDADSETATNFDLTLDVSLALTVSAPGASTSLEPLIRAWTSCVLLFDTTTPAPAPLKLKLPLPPAETATATLVASTVASPWAVTSTVPPPSIVAPSIFAVVRPPTVLVASVMAMLRPMLPVPPADTVTDVDTTVAVMFDVSSAPTVMLPPASSRLPETTVASTALLVVLCATAPLPAPPTPTFPLALTVRQRRGGA